MTKKGNAIATIIALAVAAILIWLVVIPLVKSALG